ncbi:hypothetical protein PTKIN_Ptkin17bG0095200 [Pterospermum kingtungense]
MKLEVEAISKDIVIGIQFNVFDCGGIGVVVCISHKIGDPLSFFTFVNIWAAIACGEKRLATPEFLWATLFPRRSITGYKPKYSPNRSKTCNKEVCVYPIRPLIDALSAFIWSRFVDATQVQSRPKAFSAVFHLVNLRARMDPPLPDYYLGNLYIFAMIVPSMDGIERCHNLVNQIRDSIRKINKEYTKRIQDREDHLDYVKMIAERPTRGETNFFL